MMRFFYSLSLSFLFSLSFYGNSAEQKQKKELPSVGTYLRRALHNLTETDEMADQSLEDLAGQREALYRIKKNVIRAGRANHRAGNILNDMENPVRAYFFPGTIPEEPVQRKARFLKSEGISQGRVTVREEKLFVFSRWREKELLFCGDSLCYKSLRTGKLNKKIPLEGASLKFAPFKIFRKYNALEIFNSEGKSLLVFFVENQEEYEAWKKTIEQKILSLVPERIEKEQRASKICGFSEEDDHNLDHVIGLLDGLLPKARVMGKEIEDQTDLVEDLNSELEKLDPEVRKNIWRTRKIR